METEQNNVQETTQNVETEQEQSVNNEQAIDINLIAKKAEERALRSAKSAFSDMLKQEGVDFKEAKKLISDWEYENYQKNENLKILQKDSENYKKLIEEHNKLKMQNTVISKGIPLDKSERYIALANTYVSDDTDFNSAIEKALQDFPVQVKKEVTAVPFSNGTGTQVSEKELTIQEKMNINYMKAKKGD